MRSPAHWFERWRNCCSTRSAWASEAIDGGGRGRRHRATQLAGRRSRPAGERALPHRRAGLGEPGVTTGSSAAASCRAPATSPASAAATSATNSGVQRWAAAAIAPTPPSSTRRGDERIVAGQDLEAGRRPGEHAERVDVEGADGLLEPDDPRVRAELAAARRRRALDRCGTARCRRRSARGLAVGDRA